MDFIKMKKIALSTGALAGSLAADKILVDSYKNTAGLAESANQAVSNIGELNTLSAILNNSSFVSGSIAAYFVADKTFDYFQEAGFILPSTNKILKDTAKALPFMPLSTAIHEYMHAVAAYAVGIDVVGIQPFIGGSLDGTMAPHISALVTVNEDREMVNALSDFIISSAGIFGTSALTLGIAELVERTNASKTVKFATRGFATLTSAFGALYSFFGSDETRYNNALAKILFPALSHETGEVLSHVITSAAASAFLVYNVYKIKKSIDEEHKKAAEELGMDVKEYKIIEKNRQEELFNALLANSDADKSQVALVNNKLSTVSLPKFFDEMEAYMSDAYLMEKPCRKLAKAIKVPKELLYEAAESYISGYKDILETEDECEYREKRHNLRMHTIYEYLPLFKMMKGKKSMPFIPKPSLLSVIEAANK